MKGLISGIALVLLAGCATAKPVPVSYCMATKVADCDWRTAPAPNATHPAITGADDVLKALNTIPIDAWGKSLPK